MFRQEDFAQASAPDRAEGSVHNTAPRGKPPREGGWHESSWELFQGLEISDLEGDLPEEFFERIKTRQ